MKVDIVGIGERPRRADGTGDVDARKDRLGELIGNVRGYHQSDIDTLVHAYLS